MKILISIRGILIVTIQILFSPDNENALDKKSRISVQGVSHFQDGIQSALPSTRIAGGKYGFPAKSILMASICPTPFFRAVDKYDSSAA